MLALTGANGIGALVAIIGYMILSIQRNIFVLIKVAGILAFAAGIVLQFILSGTCGGDGFEDCFVDCPLPNPTIFNHNALFHLFVIVGYMLMTIGEVFVPASTLFVGNEKEEDEDDDQVDEEEERAKDRYEDDGMLSYES